MKKFSHIAIVALASVSLAGCQSPFFASLGFGGKAKAERAPAPKLVGAQLIEEGRFQLAQGHISAAVATYRLARMDPSTAAQAENGLGVAYAKLGRFDLADRYFRSAVEREPEDMRFTANLLRLQRTVMMARAKLRTAEPALAKAEPAAEPKERVASAPPVHRLSDGIVNISTREDLGARPRMAIAFLERPEKPQPEAQPDVPVADLAEAAESVEEASKQKVIVVPQ